MTYRFLSAPWFAEVARIREELGDLGLSPAIRDLVVNVEVREAPEGIIEAHLAAGTLAQGFAPDAPTKLRLPYDIAHRAFVEQDRGALVQAFLSGKIQVEGDLLRLMPLQSGGETDKSRKLLERITAITV